VPNLGDFDAVKMRQRAVWASGDFGRIGAVTVLVGELLCESVMLHARENVLDVATGTGNTALSAARRRCNVTGVDFVANLLEQARTVAAAEHLTITFQEADAESLPFPDRTFDCVLSTFGAMFAPNQEKAASEILRVCRKGGRIGLSSWTPESLAGRLFATLSKRVPPAPGLKSPLRWGTNDGLRELFGSDGRIEVQRRFVTFRGDSPQGYVEYLRRFFGPVVKVFEALEPAQAAELEAELVGLVNEVNSSGDDTVLIKSEYLEAVIYRP
jgi:ubiquinone/menaquinone biosynthesis C-methylase UbiE